MLQSVSSLITTVPTPPTNPPTNCLTFTFLDFLVFNVGDLLDRSVCSLILFALGWLNGPSHAFSRCHLDSLRRYGIGYRVLVGRKEISGIHTGLEVYETDAEKVTDRLLC